MKLTKLFEGPIVKIKKEFYSIGPAVPIAVKHFMLDYLDFLNNLLSIKLLLKTILMQKIVSNKRSYSSEKIDLSLWLFVAQIFFCRNSRILEQKTKKNFYNMVYWAEAVVVV